MRVNLVTAVGTTELRVDFETHHEPRLELLMQARLSHAKKRLFSLI